VLAAASVVLARAPVSAELLLVQRADNLRFMGGFCAFPGGKVGPADAHLAEAPASDGPGPLLTPQHVAAIRELFEETGVLLAHRSDGTIPPSDPSWNELRRELLADRLSFADLLARLGLSLRADDLKPIGSLVTPAFSPMRFDTAFYLAVLPAGQEMDVWPGELTRGLWGSAGDLLRRWNAGELLISPPTISLLETIQHAIVEHLPLGARPIFDHLQTAALPTIWFSPGVLMVPLEVKGLPPTTHTNAFLVGNSIRYLIDPGPTDPAEQDRMFAVIDRQRSERAHLAGIILTHHHPDHIGSAVRAARVYGVPILAHAVTAQLLRGKVPIDRELRDGEKLDLGPAPHGKGHWSLQAIHTPGHAPGHLVFWEESYRLLFAADMISTISSVIIAPPEGDLAQYLDSLRLLLRLPARLLLPAHGSPSARPAFVIEEALAHRRTREEQLLTALKESPRSIVELLPELYRGLPANLMRLAELQTLAGLQKLQREGRAEAIGEGKWRLLND
jgi:glyoxylase-like metal-dependent hydrolase (beta-lactamase superfamily II)/8-oxo-dGTP pyrophosphatase MutT (NUDIX family)